MMNREAEMQEIYQKNGWGTPNVSFGVHPAGTIETLETAALAKPKPQTAADTVSGQSKPASDGRN